MNAVRAGWAEFRDPGSAARTISQEELSDTYSRRWAYFRNISSAVYSPNYHGRCDADGRGLYRHTRLLFNPIPTIVGFYEDHLFSGVAQEVKDDKGLVIAHLATPLMDSTDTELKLAVAQIDQFSNWLSEANRFVRYGSVTGSVMVEVVDDLEGEKVAHRIVWPSWVKEIEIDASGNVKSYTLEYKAYDRAAKKDYTYRKEVDSGEFRYFKDDKPFNAFGQGQSKLGGADGYMYNDADDRQMISTGVYENPYGFCPAVWAKHYDDGDTRGIPAVWNEEKIDEVNSAASHGLDHGHKAIEAGKVIFTDGTIMAVTGATGSSEKGKSGGIYFYDPRFDWQLVKAPQGGQVADLGSSFDLAKLDPSIERLLKSFESDYPELQAQEIIRNKNQVSGAALERMLAPSQSKLDRAAAQYGQQVIKLLQMAVAIAGWRRNGGGWTRRDAQRDVFLPFNLDSWRKGDLNMTLKRPLLVQSTPMEDEELKAKKAERAKNLDGIVDEFEKLKVAGYSEGEAKDIITRKRTVDVIPETEQ